MFPLYLNQYGLTTQKTRARPDGRAKTCVLVLREIQGKMTDECELSEKA
jgi:hypothetical protein